MAALSVFGLGVLGFIIYGVVIKLLASGNIFDALAITGFIVMIACGLASVILFAKAKDAGDAAAKRPSQPQVAAGGESTKELLTEGNFEPVPSVTDRTTELLVVEKRERS